MSNLYVSTHPKFTYFELDPVSEYVHGPRTIRESYLTDTTQQKGHEI